MLYDFPVPGKVLTSSTDFRDLDSDFKELLVFLIYLFYFGCHQAFLAACGLSLVADSRDWALGTAPGLLTATASLAVEHRL